MCVCVCAYVNAGGLQGRVCVCAGVCVCAYVNAGGLQSCVCACVCVQQYACVCVGGGRHCPLQLFGDFVQREKEEKAWQGSHQDKKETSLESPKYGQTLFTVSFLMPLHH